MNADRCEITDDPPNVFAITFRGNTLYFDDEDFAVVAIRQQARDIESLRDELAAVVAERDGYRDEFGGLCHTLSVGSEGRPEMTATDWRKRVDEGIDFLLRPLIAERDQLRARLAALEREPTPDECISIAFWHSEECEFCCINQSKSEDYGRAMFDAVRAIMSSGGESGDAGG